MLKKYFTLIIFVSLFMVSTDIIAQNEQGCANRPPNAPPCPPNETPIDGGVVFLLAAGVVFGIKKLNDKLLVTDS